MKPPTPDTTLSTRPSKGLELVTLVLETSQSANRLVCYGPPFDGVRTVRSWRFTGVSLDNHLIDEIGATVEDVAITGLLRAVGWPQRFPLVAGEPPDPS